MRFGVDTPLIPVPSVPDVLPWDEIDHQSHPSGTTWGVPNRICNPRAGYGNDGRARTTLPLASVALLKRTRPDRALGPAPLRRQWTHLDESKDGLGCACVATAQKDARIDADPAWRIPPAGPGDDQLPLPLPGRRSGRSRGTLERVCAC